MKKMFAMVLTLVVAFSLMTANVALAADAETNDESITVFVEDIQNILMNSALRWALLIKSEPVGIDYDENGYQIVIVELEGWTFVVRIDSNEVDFLYGVKKVGGAYNPTTQVIHFEEYDLQIDEEMLYSGQDINFLVYMMARVHWYPEAFSK